MLFRQAELTAMSIGQCAYSVRSSFSSLSESCSMESWKRTSYESIFVKGGNAELYCCNIISIYSAIFSAIESLASLKLAEIELISSDVLDNVRAGVREVGIFGWPRRYILQSRRNKVRGTTRRAVTLCSDCGTMTGRILDRFYWIYDRRIIEESRKVCSEVDACDRGIVFGKGRVECPDPGCNPELRVGYEDFTSLDIA